MLAQEMLAQELAARFGPKLREIEPLGQRLPAAMSDLLRVIEQSEAIHPGGSDDVGSRSDAEETPGNSRWEVQMSDSVYKVVTLIGTSTESWEKAAKAAVEAASHSLRELRIAEVIKQDMVVTDGKVEAYRTKVRLSFKYEGNQ
jgi:flavin-binding protein dodecin